MGEVAKVLTGGTPKTSEEEYWEPKEIPWMSSGEVNKRRLNQTDSMISERGLENSSARWIKEHSVLIALAGQGKTRGTVAINNIPLTTNQSIAAIIPDHRLNFEFLFQNFIKRYDELRQISSGDGTRGGLNKQIVLNVTIPLPQNEEQVRIGGICKKMDSLIAATQGKLDQLELVKKALLQHLFDQSMRFKGYSDPWEKRKLGTLAPLRGGFAFQSAEFKKSGVPIVRISNIKSDGTIGGDFVYYQEKKNDNAYSLPLNATLLAMSGATTGKVAVLRKKFKGKVYQNQRVGYFSKVNGISYRFISVLVESTLFLNQLKSVLVAGAQPNVSAKEVDQFKFNVPNSLNEQISVGKLFESLNKLIAATQSKLVDYQQLKKSLLQELFV